jgi:hypothetical protein
MSRSRVRGTGWGLPGAQIGGKNYPFDHGIIHDNHEGIHRWMFRRWNAFSIATTSFFGLAFSIPFGHYFIGIRAGCTWSLPVALFAAILVFVMIWAWHDTMNMLEFMIRLASKEAKT